MIHVFQKLRTPSMVVLHGLMRQPVKLRSLKKLVLKILHQVGFMSSVMSSNLTAKSRKSCVSMFRYYLFYIDTKIVGNVT